MRNYTPHFHYNKNSVETLRAWEDIGSPSYSFRGARSLTRTETVIREKCTARRENSATRRDWCSSHADIIESSSSSRAVQRLRAPSPSTSVCGVRDERKRRFVSLCASTPVDSRMSPPGGRAEPVRRKGVAERGTGAGKGALTLPTLRPGVGLPPTSSSSGASASLPSSTSSVRSSVCPRVYRPTLSTPIFDIPRFFFCRKCGSVWELNET